MNSGFILKVLAIAIPVTIQELIISSNALLDNFMISKVGTAAVAATGSANKFIEIFVFVIIGISFANGTLTSQFSAKKDKDAEKGFSQSLSTNLFVGVLLSVIFMLFYLIFKNQVASIFSTNIEVQQYIKEYLNIAIFCCIPLTINFAMITSLKSIKRLKLTLFATTICISTNIILNYLLIEGNYGFPVLGVKGAALATLISEIVASIILIAGTELFNYPVKININKMLNVPRSFIIKYVKMAIPMIANFLSVSLSYFIIHVIVGSFGKEALAAYAIISPIEMIFVHLFMGFGSAGNILVGKDLGKNNFDRAYERTIVIGMITFVTSIITGILIYLNAEYISIICNASLETTQNIYLMLKILATTLWVQALIRVLFSILTSGGDFSYISKAGVFAAWFLAVPLAYIGRYYFNLNLIEIYLLTRVNRLVFMTILSLRVKSKKWMKNLTDN